MAKTLFKNGKFFTADEERKYVTAMLVDAGKISWIGGEAELDPEILNKGDLKTVDLGGRRVIPGLVDSHMHPTMLAGFSKQISALPPSIYSIAGLKDKIREVRKSQAAGEWIEGWGYDEGKLKEHRAPNRYDLDAACSDSPVSIMRTCAHIYSVNSKLLELAGITKDTPDPEGGQIDRDKDGEPTGILRENARFLITAIRPKPSDDEFIGSLVDLGRLLSYQGITTVGDMGSFEPGDFYSQYLKAVKKGFKQRVAMYLMWDNYKGDPSFDIAREQMDSDSQIKINGLKLIGDGSVSGRTAWMNRAYPNDSGSDFGSDSGSGSGSGSGYCGMPVCSDEDIESALAFCKTRRCQLSVHSMGGRAIDRILRRIEQEDPWTGGDRPYLRLEHVTDPSDWAIETAAEKGVYFSSQPIFLYSEIESYVNNLGMDWLRRCYPYRTMLDKGIKLSFSTDAPATAWAIPSDPFSCIKGAVTRRAYDGTDCGQSQAVDIETAIRLYTIEGARLLEFPETGMLRQGYSADFVVLDRDILKIPKDEIDSVKVDETYIRGERVWRR